MLQQRLLARAPLPGIRNWWNCQSIKIDTNRYLSITINRLILEIDEQSMRQDSVTFKRNNSQISIANRWKSMYQWTCFMWLSIDHQLTNTNQYQLTDWYRFISIDWSGLLIFPHALRITSDVWCTRQLLFLLLLTTALPYGGRVPGPQGGTQVY